MTSKRTSDLNKPSAGPVDRSPTNSPTKTGLGKPQVEDLEDAEPKGRPSSDRSKTQSAVTPPDDPA
jgi:hypothetical protein